MKFNFEFDNSESAKMGALFLTIGNALCGNTTAQQNVEKPLSKSTPKPAGKPKSEDVETGNDETEETITIDAIREKLTELTQAGKGSKVKAILTEFNAKKVSEIAEDDYAAVWMKISKL